MFPTLNLDTEDKKSKYKKLICEILRLEIIVTAVHYAEVFAQTSQVEEAVKGGLKNAEALEQSILAKAFRGELVPQDPNDEPASVLLERIRAQRVAVGRKGKFQTLLEFSKS